MRVDRPYLTIIVAMSADGKIADYQRHPARFPSPQDKHHLETLISQMDAVLVGAETLRCYGSSLPVTNPELLAQRKTRNQSLQPIHIITSRSGQIHANLRFFEQSFPKGLLTTSQGLDNWLKEGRKNEFDHYYVYPNLNWITILQDWKHQGLNKIGILGGGELIASLVQENLVDELYITLCPYLIGGRSAPTFFGGKGFLSEHFLRLSLVEMKSYRDEIFLHYKTSDNAHFSE